MGICYLWGGGEVGGKNFFRVKKGLTVQSFFSKRVVKIFNYLGSGHYLRQRVRQCKFKNCVRSKFTELFPMLIFYRLCLHSRNRNFAQCMIHILAAEDI